MASSNQARPINKYFSLCDAIKKKNKEAVRQLILNDAPVNPPTKGFFNTPLHWAILKSNDIEIVNMLIERGADLSSKNHYKRTPLTVAIKLRKQEVIKLLFDKGVHVSEDLGELFVNMMKYEDLEMVETIVKCLVQFDESTDLRNLVSLIAARGKISILQILLTHNINVTRKDIPKEVIINNSPQYRKCLKLLLQHGYTMDALLLEKQDFRAVYAAVEKGYMTIVDKLLKTGINVNNFSRKTGFTLLHLACFNGNINMVKLLIEYKANISIRVRQPDLKLNGWQHNTKIKAIVQRTALFIAVNNADIGITKLLVINGAKIRDEPDLLNVAIKTQCMKMIEWLLEFGADINIVDHKGVTPLHSYIMEGDEEERIKYTMVEFLLSKGACINSQTYENKVTSLHSAVEKGYTNIVKLLIDNHADITLASAKGYVLLHVAVINNRIDIVEILLKLGVDVNIKDGRGYTSLHHACSTNNEIIVDKLLENNADINCVDQTGRTPLHLMCTSKFSIKIIFKLLSHHADVNVKDQGHETPLHFLTRIHPIIHLFPSINSNEFENVYKIFLEFIDDINAVDSEGRTPLFIACSNEDLLIIQVLLEHKADVNIPDASGKMPLHAAANCTRIEIIKVLLENNAKTSHVDKDENTILHVGAQTDNVEILNIVDKLSIDINAKNNEGNTALHIATENRCYRMAEKLLEQGADINIMNNGNQTVFDVAIDCIIKKRAEVEENRRNYLMDDDGRQEYIEILESIISMFHKRIIKLKSAGLYVSSRILNTVLDHVNSHEYNFSNNGEKMQDFEKECKTYTVIFKEENIWKHDFS